MGTFTRQLQNFFQITVVEPETKKKKKNQTRLLARDPHQYHGAVCTGHNDAEQKHCYLSAHQRQAYSFTPLRVAP